MAGQNLEDLKKNSKQLRGTLAETLADPETLRFNDDEKQLVKFHGLYQQDDRDERVQRMKDKAERAWILMVRSKVPGGGLTAEQYLAHDTLAQKYGNGTLRITTRQDFQFHGVLKDNLKTLVRDLNEVAVTTYGACGDVARNVMAPPAPFYALPYRQAMEDALNVSDSLLPSSKAYYDIWLDGEKVPAGAGGADPIYKDAYLPRKFKACFMVPPHNDIDIHSHDLAYVADVENGEVKGYTVMVGGGFGMDHGKVATYPFLAVPMFYVAREHAKAVARAVITAFRDYGDRINRKHARLKYVLVDRGVEWFRKEVESRLEGVTVQEPKPFEIGSVTDWLGWHEQHDPDDRLFLGVRVECGRIRDYTTDEPLTGRYRSALKAIVEQYKTTVRLTGNQNIILGDIKRDDQAAINALLAEHEIKPAADYTQAHRMSIACVALPTCGLALSESERAFPGLMDQVDEILRELNIQEEHILFRMTGCPNGCARPYNADFAFVGRGIGKYAMYVGGSFRGNRMAGLAHKTVNLEDLPGVIRGYLEAFVKDRQSGESFSDYWGRTHENGPAPHPEQFHVELSERKARRDADKKAGKGSGPIG